MTVILIAHRLSTVINCSKIYLVDKGSIIDSGSFKDLKKNRIFREMSENF